MGTKKVMTAMKDNCDGVGRRSVRLLYDLDGWPAGRGGHAGVAMNYGRA